jgi:hypothetical protein
MIDATSVTPVWSLKNLEDHYKKRNSNDAECFKDVLGLEADFTKNEYKDLCKEAFHEAYIRYEAREWNEDRKCFHAKRHYRLDGRSLKVVADLTKKYFITCFHEHYGKPHRPEHLKKPSLDQVFDYLIKIENKKKQGLIEDFKIQIANKASRSLDRRALIKLALKVNKLNKEI